MIALIFSSMTVRHCLIGCGGVFLLCLLWPVQAQQITVLTHDSFVISESVVSAFTEETGIEVRFLQAGDAGEVINRAILTKNNPLADLLFGIDNSLIARARQADLFEAYQSPLLRDVPQRYHFADNLVTPVDLGFVNFNLDKAYFAERSLDLPGELDDLILPEYKAMTVLSNPATSSPGLAFMLTTIAKYGEDWLRYWEALRDNEVHITDGWTDAYYSAFSRYGGERPIVLSYASSPAAEVIFATETLDDAPTDNLFCEQCVFQQIEAVGLLKGSSNQAEAKRFIDFMLSVTFQNDVPLSMFVYPVNEQAEIPLEFERYSQQPSENEIAQLEEEVNDAQLSLWLEQWTQVVLQGRRPEAVQRSN